jgi:RNA polymerase subunit RPABC4/transcription elongation factor Spt4
VVISERRCPSCGALVSGDAAWCGQCYVSLSEEQTPPEQASSDEAPSPETAATAETGPGDEAAEAAESPEPQEGGPAWPCPVCEHRNSMDLNVCPVCGTPFGRLFEEPEVRRQIEPKDAAAWSILLPGVGHLKAGRRADGVARLVLFAWVVGTLAVMLISRFGTGGLGPTASFVYLFVIVAVLLYVESAVDAYRVAAGDDPLVSSRMLMWAVVAVVMLLVLLGSLVVLPAARGQ